MGRARLHRRKCDRRTMRIAVGCGLAALADRARAAEERSIAAVDDALEYQAASEQRILQIEAERSR